MKAAKCADGRRDGLGRAATRTAGPLPSLAPTGGRTAGRVPAGEPAVTAQHPQGRGCTVVPSPRPRHGPDRRHHRAHGSGRATWAHMPRSPQARPAHVRHPVRSTCRACSRAHAARHPAGAPPGMWGDGRPAGPDPRRVRGRDRAGRSRQGHPQDPSAAVVPGIRRERAGAPSRLGAPRTVCLTGRA